MTTIYDGSGAIVAEFKESRDAVVCIGPMARVLGITLEIVPAPSGTLVVDFPKNVSLKDIEKDSRQKLVAKP